MIHELHVPPRCTGELKWKKENDRESSFTLSLLGGGYGNGCRISFAVEQEIPARTICCKFIQKIDVHVKVYALPSANGERYETSVDVIGPRGRQLVTWPDCPFCGIDIDKVDEFEYQLGEPIDLRNWDSRDIESFSL